MIDPGAAEEKYLALVEPELRKVCIYLEAEIDDHLSRGRRRFAVDVDHIPHCARREQLDVAVDKLLDRYRIAGWSASVFVSEFGGCKAKLSFLFSIAAVNQKEAKKSWWFRLYDHLAKVKSQ